MKRLVRYKSGSEYIIDDLASIVPGDASYDEYSLERLSKEEVKLLEKNPKNKLLRKKLKLIKNG